MNISASLLDPVRTLIRQRCGLNCEEEALAEAVAQRQKRVAIPLLADYFALLDKEISEFDNLVALLTNNETYFFREADQFELLLENLMPDLLASRNKGEVIRILSAGCSSGEEPYSIAIALLEKFGENAARMFSILGADIDQDALSKAVNARYGLYSFRALPDALRARYFEPAGETQYLLSDKIRSLVQFQRLNLLAEPPPTILSEFDAVFFRNVSIYFDEATRYDIQKNLCKLMKEQSYLLMGNTETLANDLGVFQLKQHGGVFYFSKGKAQNKPVSKNQKIRFADDADSAQTPAEYTANPKLEPIRSLIADQLWESALIALQTCETKEQELLLLEAWARLQTKDIAGAEQLALEVFQQNEWSLDASVMLGLIARSQERNEQAILWLKRAVYINPDCWVAHYYLAELYRNSKEFEAAGRCYKQVLQALTGQFQADGGLSVPLSLPIADIHFLCSRHLELLATPELMGKL